jgi:type II secretory pathway pseudopilin PulG
MSRLGQRQGFSLVEALVALAITALTMTVGMALLARQSDVSRRVRAHLEATQAIESTLESLRAGVIPLASGPVTLPTESSRSEALVVWLEVEHKADPPGLAEVLVEARYVVGTRTMQRSIRTMVWRAP